MPEYKSTDEYWIIWDKIWEEESKKVYREIKDLKKFVNEQKLAEETKKKMLGMINDIGRFIVSMGKHAGEQHFRELEYNAAIARMNDERRIFKEIVIDLSKKQ